MFHVLTPSVSRLWGFLLYLFIVRCSQLLMMPYYTFRWWNSRLNLIKKGLI